MGDLRIRVVFESAPDPDRFRWKERAHCAVGMVYPPEVKQQLRTWEIARKMINDPIYKAPALDPLEASAEVVMIDLFPLGDVHRVLDDGTRVWLSEAEWFYLR
jgi:hypothetical protein